MNGKLTIKFLDKFIVFEGTTKDDIVQQGIIYSYVKYPNNKLYQIPTYYGNFIPYTWKKDDPFIYYRINGTKFILDEDITKKPYLKKAEHGNMKIDIFSKSFYSGLSYHFINTAPRNKATNWRLLYQLSRDNGNHNSGVCINYEQLHNFETRNIHFYNNQPKYYLKYVYDNIKNSIIKDKFEVFDADTNKPVTFNPNHILSETFDDKTLYTYYDNEDWQKRISFIEEHKTEKVRLEHLEYKVDKQLFLEDAIPNDLQKTVTYNKNGTIYQERKFTRRTAYMIVNIYNTDIEMSRNAKGLNYYNVLIKHDISKNKNYTKKVPLTGFYKGIQYFTNDSITSVDGKFYASKKLKNARISYDDLFYIGIECSHRLFPTKTWSTILNTTKKSGYIINRTYKYLPNYKGIIFQYEAENGKKITTTVFNKEIGEVKTMFRVKIEINKKYSINSLIESYKIINESQRKLNKNLKEYTEKMKKVNDSLKSLNKK